MYPQNQPQQQDLFSKLFANKMVTGLVIGGFIIVLVTIVTLIANSGGSSAPAQISAMQVHLSSLADITDAQTDDLHNGDLRDQNASLGILLAGGSNDMGAMLTEIYGPTEPDEQTGAANIARRAALTTAVESAINTNNVDEIYQKEITAEMGRVDAQLTSLSAETGGSASLVLEDIRERLATASDSFAEVTL